MKKYLAADDTITSIRLELRHPKGKEKVWVLVEGDSDRKLYSKLLSAPNVSVEEAHGGIEGLRKAISALNGETNQVIGIRDADFMHLLDSKEEIVNLFVTDCHDLEMMLIQSDRTFKSVCAEFHDGDLTSCLMTRAKLLTALRFLGGVRYFNCIHDCKLNFRKLPVNSFFDPDTLSLDRDRCIDVVNERSPSKDMPMSVLAVDNIVKDIDDSYNLCCGHDVSKAMASYFSRDKAKGLNEERMTCTLRVAYSIDDFKRTKLYRQLESWEAKSRRQLFGCNSRFGEDEKPGLTNQDAKNCGTVGNSDCLYPTTVARFRRTGAGA